MAAWLHDPKSLKAAYGGPEGISQRLAKADAARRKFDVTGEVEYVPSQSPTDGEAAMPFPLDFYQDPQRGNRKEWTNRFAVMGWREWLTFDMVALAGKVKIPTLMVHSDKAAFPENVRRFAANLAGPKELLWAEGEQTDFYDQDAQVTVGVDAAARHFSQTLRSDAENQSIRDQSMAGVRGFFAALEARDVDRFLKVWAEDGIQLMPYSPDGFPKRLEGKAALRGQYAPLPSNFEWMKFPLVRLVATDDPNVVIAEFKGDIKVKATGGKYDNAYVGVFDFAGGKLKRYTEYFDPRLLTRAFSIPESDEVAIRHTVDQVGVLADARDWDAVAKLFADKVRIDYTSLAGGEPAEVAPADLVAGWKQGFARFTRTQHLVAKHRIDVDGDVATCRSEVTATHLKDEAGKQRWTCGGKYIHRLRRTPTGWKVEAMTFTLEWEQGER